MNKKRVYLLAQRALAVGLAMILCWALTPQPVQAEDFYPADVSELIEFIKQANDNSDRDFIYLTPGAIYTLVESYEDRNGPNGLPPITSDITILSVGDPAIIERSPSDEVEQFRLFYVEDGAYLYLDNVILAGGELPSGASFSEGGAIYTRGNVNCLNGTIQNNSADRGGAIYNEDRLTLDSCTIQENEAAFGGGVYNTGDGTLFFGYTALNNTATESGGAIYNDGAFGIVSWQGKITDNRANRCAGIANIGGEFHLSLASVSDNTAETLGGGICNLLSTEGEGGQFYIEYGEIIANQAGTRGGGIYNLGQMRIYENSDIWYNSVGFPDLAAPGMTFGGGIYNGGELAIEDTFVYWNSVYGGNGRDGSLGINRDGSDAFGGAISNEGNLLLDNVLLQQNMAIGGRGADVPDGAGGDGGAAWGGGIYNTGEISTNGVVTIYLNYARMSEGGVGPEEGGQFGRGYGGGLANASRAVMSKSMFWQNTATYGGGASNAIDAELSLMNTTFSGNMALAPVGAKGGAIYNKDGVVNLTHVTVTRNSAEAKAGGIWSRGGETNIQNSILAGNTASSGVYPDCPFTHTIRSLGHNVFGDSINCPADPTIGDISLKDLGLDITDILETGIRTYPEIWGHGSTGLHPLIPDSRAIDAADPTVCPSEDQRGGARPLDGDDDGTAACDIGAHEYNPDS